MWALIACEGGPVPLLSGIGCMVVKANLTLSPQNGSWGIGKEDLAVTQSSVPIQALPVEACVTAGKLPHLSEPQFTHQ